MAWRGKIKEGERILIGPNVAVTFRRKAAGVRASGMYQVVEIEAPDEVAIVRERENSTARPAEK